MPRRLTRSGPVPIGFGRASRVPTAASGRRSDPVGGSSNGRTANSDSASLGSNPSPPATTKPLISNRFLYLPAIEFVARFRAVCGDRVDLWFPERRIRAGERRQRPEISLGRRSAVDFSLGGRGWWSGVAPVDLGDNRGAGVSGEPGGSGAGGVVDREADERALLRPAERKMTGQRSGPLSRRR